MLRVVVLASGGLGLIVLKEVFEKQEVVAVMTDRNSSSIISFCKEKNTPCFAGNPRNNRAAGFIKDLDCEVLLSVNYLFVIENDLIQLPRKYAINVHGSLLPRYRGRTPHVWSIINGETETGITAHLIDELVDNGKILKQYKVAIEPDDTGAGILQKFNQYYPVLIEEVLAGIENNSLVFVNQDNTKATYFGKRTPEDGQINWDWFRERARNWIRAQAAPYPGAFTFYDSHKIHIHKAEFSDMGFTQDTQNGTIVHIDDDILFVKTPNGVLALSNIITDFTLKFEIGKVLK